MTLKSGLKANKSLNLITLRLRRCLTTIRHKSIGPEADYYLSQRAFELEG